MKRYQEKLILKDLKQKLVLLVGPRQSGKTWLAKELAKQFNNSVYLNYDSQADRKIIQDESWLNDVDLLIFDELHKMPDWKNYLKGVYDTKTANLKILVTGSARLDSYDHMGDSLAGRYFRHRLLPLSLSELKQTKQETNLNKLLQFGGFPEPYLSGDLKEAARWRLQYTNSLLSTDVFEFDQIQNIKSLQLLFHLLKDRVGSPVSYQSLSEDLSIAPTTVKKYIEILEALFIIFRVTPFSNNIARSILKEPKIYFFDSAMIENNEGAKLENLVAISLLKYCYAMEDYEAQEYKLHYLRTKDGQEVDFALANNTEIQSIIEVKSSQTQVDKSLINFHKRYGPKAIQLVRSLRTDFQAADIEVLNLEKFLSNLQY
ncbi:MAG: ATP-binding protein [Cyanobacteria bacterium]|nr:ATP-binding protein [Cyanobacteriota bacterium]MDA1021005.1 ATP-binding protein [Cyanobacteriota bacterium]